MKKKIPFIIILFEFLKVSKNRNKKVIRSSHSLEQFIYNLLTKINYYTQNKHIKPVVLDNTLSSKILFKIFLKFDNPKKLQIFKKDDIDFFIEKYKFLIDDKIKMGSLDFIFEIFDRFVLRYQERIDEIEIFYDNFKNNFVLIDYIDTDYINDKRSLNRDNNKSKDISIFWLSEIERKEYLNRYLNYELIKDLKLEQDFTTKKINQLKIETINSFKTDLSVYQNFDIFQLISLPINSYLYFFDYHTKYLSPVEFVSMSNKLLKPRMLIESYGLNNNDISNYDIIRLNNKEIGFIKFNIFKYDTPDFVKEKINIFNSKNISNLIIDLRDNLGGILETTMKLLDMFLDVGPGIVVKIKKKINANKMVKNGRIYNGNLIILVNENSASASELFCEILREYKRAIIVGTSDSTRGKGTGQNTYNLNKYGAIRITIGSIHNPSGDSVQFKGVTPDIKIPDYYSDLNNNIYKKEKNRPNAIMIENIDSTNINVDNIITNQKIKDLKYYINQNHVFNEYQKLVNLALIESKDNQKFLSKIPLDKDNKINFEKKKDQLILRKNKLIDNIINFSNKLLIKNKFDLLNSFTNEKLPVEYYDLDLFPIFLLSTILLKI